MNFLWHFLYILYLFGDSATSMDLDMMTIPYKLDETRLDCVHFCMANPKLSNRIYKCYNSCVSEQKDISVVNSREIPQSGNTYNTALICRDDSSLTMKINITEPEGSETILVQFHIFDGEGFKKYYLANSPFGFLDILEPNRRYFVHGSGFRGDMYKLKENFDILIKSFATLSSHQPIEEVSDIAVTNFRIKSDCMSCLFADVTWTPSIDYVCHYRIAWHDTYNGEFNEIPLLVELKTQPSYQATISNLQFGQEYKIAVSGFMKTMDQLKTDFNWITFVTPQCRDMLTSLDHIKNICSPLQPAKVVTTYKLVDKKIYDISVSWEKSPEPLPHSYAVAVRNLDYKSPFSVEMHLDGNQTETFFPRVEFTGSSYEITVEAIFANGKRSSTTVAKSIPRTLKVGYPIVALWAPFFVLLLGIVLYYAFYRKCKNHPCASCLSRTSSNVEENIVNMNIPLSRLSHELKESGLEAINDEYEIRDEKISMNSGVIGEGQFGIVRRAMVMINGKNIMVAAKELKGDTRDQKQKFLEEITIMKSVPEHKNILRLIGHRTDPLKNFLLLTEYCAKGSLLDFLRKKWETHSCNQARWSEFSDNFINYNQISESKPHMQKYINLSDIEDGGGQDDFCEIAAYNIVENPCYRAEEDFVVIDKNNLSLKSLLDIAIQVAEGMSFLGVLKVVHRDLAARNVLIDENNIAKIADFGLSRDIYEDGMYTLRRGGRVPIKWMAIEALQRQHYTTHSDVWSYGVLLYEIITLGCIPYPTIANDKLLSYLNCGSRMEKPRCCPQWLYETMMSCWKETHFLRPSFTDIAKTLTEAKDKIPDEELFDVDKIKEDTNLVRDNPHKC
ncbi:hypothetical protein DMENIID0001_102240 [Sergentomyia squamirostris]